MLDERAYIIIQKLIERPFNEKMDLLRQTNLTHRQFDYSLEKINSWLLDNFQKPIILNNHDQLAVYYETKEFLIKEKTDKLLTQEYVLSIQERIKFIYSLLFLDIEYLSINHFIDVLKVGKTTVMNDLKALSVKLLENQISIKYNRNKGYYLEGNELDIRYLMLKLISEDLGEDLNTQLLDYFLHANQMNEYESTKSIVLFFMKKHNISSVESRLTDFIYSFIFLIQRLVKQQKNTVVIHKASSLKTLKEYHFAKELLKYFQYENEEGISYLCGWILGLSMGNTNQHNEDYAMIMNLVEQIRNRFESLSGIRFENPTAVSNQIYRHFRPVYYRLYFKLPIVNPLCEKIKEEYSDLYRIVNETLKPMSAFLGREIPEEEIAYLTIHFASLATTFDEKNTRQKVALVVCPNGVGSSSITYTVLRSIFPEFSFLIPIETSQIDKVKDHYDVVFSTVPHIRLLYTRKPVFIVSPIMNTAEKYRLIRDVYTEIGNSIFKLPSVDCIAQIVEKYAAIKDKEMLKRELYEYLIVNENVSLEKEQALNLSQITSPNIIQLHKTANDWQDAIYVSARPLVKENRVTEQYVEKMIDNARKDGPYMVIMKHVALPHARPIDGVNQLSLGITVFNEPVFFDNSSTKPVKYVFCLAATDQEKHLNALSQLVKFLENSDFYATLDNSHNPNDVYSYICKYENLI